MKHLYAVVPVSLLVNPALPWSAKLMWALLSLDHQEGDPTPSISSLHRRSGLTRTTVRQSLRRLSRAGLTSTDHISRVGHAEPAVHIPVALLCDRRLSASARLLYGALRLVPGFRYPSGRVTYAQLSKVANASHHTVRRVLSELVHTDWVKIHRPSPRAPITYALQDPRILSSEAAIARSARRLNKAKFLGEALMREYLTALIDSDEYEDDASPGFLVNPLTQECLQLDRYYPPRVALEFNGPQHYGPTQLYSAEEAEEQEIRDLVKIGRCARRGIELVTVHPEDLCTEGMLSLVGSKLPLRSLPEQEAVLAFLDSVARRYRAKAGQSPALPLA